MAQTTTCTAPTVTFTPTLSPNNYSGPRTAGAVVGRGNVNISTTCNGPSTTFGLIQLQVFNLSRTTVRPSPVRGLNYQITGTPTNSGCSFIGLQGGANFFAYNFRVPGSSCTINGSFEVTITLSGQPVGSGNIWDASGLVTAFVRDFQNPSVYANNNFPNAASAFSSALPPLQASLNTTCNVSNSAIAVNLPNVTRASLATAGATTGLTPFQLELDNCTFPPTPGVPYNAFAFFSFTPPGANTTLIANTASSPAANVAAQILNSSLTPIANNTSASVNVTSAGNYSIPLYARYFATGAAGAGQYSGQVAFSLAYF